MLHSTANRLRVLHIIGSLTIGGAEWHLHKLVSKSDPARFEMAVLELMPSSSGLREKIASAGIPVFTANMGRVPTPASFLRMIKVIRNWNPDVIQAWMYHSNLLALLVKPFLHRRTPVILNIRQTLYDIRVEKFLLRLSIRLGGFLSRYSNRIIYNSHLSVTQHERLGYSGLKSCFVENAFDCDLYKPDELAGKTLRKELNIPENSFLIGYYARFHAMKDHDTFLRAASNVLRGNSDVHFVLAGDGIDSTNAKLADKIKGIENADRIHLMGVRGDMPYMNAALDIACNCGQQEGFSNAIGEAMACGVPCVAVNVGESMSIIGDSGRVVPVRDPEALSQALRELILLSSGEREALGLRARARIRENYEIHKVVSKYQDLYITTLKGNEG